MTPGKRVLFMLGDAAFDSASGHETLDAAMIAAAFEQHVALLVSGRAVWQLLDGQDGAVVESRSLAKAISALPVYEVDDIYVDADSLARTGLDVAQLCVPVKVVSLAEQTMLIRAQDVVFSGQ